MKAATHVKKRAELTASWGGLFVRVQCNLVYFIPAVVQCFSWTLQHCTFNWLYIKSFNPSCNSYCICCFPVPPIILLGLQVWISVECEWMQRKYSRTPLFWIRLIWYPHSFEVKLIPLLWLSLGANSVISKPCYFELFFMSRGTSK